MDGAVVALAMGQHGAFRVEQAAALGADLDLRKRRLRSGTWRRLSPRVLALVGQPPTWRQQVMAAVLDAGPSAVASHRTAAVLHGIPGFLERTPEVSVPRRSDHRTRLGALHETFWLPPHHTTVVDGIPTTSLARTIFDLAGHPRVNDRRVERALDTSLARLGLRMPTVQEVLAAVGRRGKPGTALMRELVGKRTEGYVPPESELEALLMAVIDAHGLEQPERQVNVGDHVWLGRVDFLYRKPKVILEADGRAYHQALLDAEADAARRARYEADGWVVIVVTWRQLVQEPELVARRIRAALRRAVA